MELLNKLSQEDKDKIERYIRNYATPHDYELEPKFAGVDRVLDYWRTSKKPLFKMFGKELILKKMIRYEKDRTALNDEMCQLAYSPNSPAAEFVNEFNIWIEKYADEYYTELGYLYPYRFQATIAELLNYYNLSENSFHGNEFTLRLPNGKNLEVRRGSKTVRMIGKIVNAFGLSAEKFEQFRLEHSRLLNQKYLEGELCLSIHPLDFMTMSDNACDWDSCMSWQNEGCYRRGTVEMMNSDCVIVAYMTSKDPFYISSTETWSNKKWRQLFVVEKDYAVSVKSYPYENHFLTCEVLKWLKELYTINLDYADDYLVNIRELDEELYEAQSNIKFYFETDCMYNDFTTTTHYALIANSYPDRDYFSTNYSGPATCMWCGSTEDFSDNCEDEACLLICESCYYKTYCSGCGEWIMGDDIHYLSDEPYCASCYDDLAYECSITGRVEHKNNLRRIMLIDGEKEGCYDRDKLYHRHYDPNPRTFIHPGVFYDDTLWTPYFKIQPQEYVVGWSYYWAIHIDDCTPNGLHLFGLSEEDVNEDCFEMELPF